MSTVATAPSKPAPARAASRANRVVVLEAKDFMGNVNHTQLEDMLKVQALDHAPTEEELNKIRRVAAETAEEVSIRNRAGVLTVQKMLSAVKPPVSRKKSPKGGSVEELAAKVPELVLENLEQNSVLKEVIWHKPSFLLELDKERREKEKRERRERKDKERREKGLLKTLLQPNPKDEPQFIPEPENPLQLNLTPKQLRKKYFFTSKLDDRAPTGSYLMSQDLAKTVVDLMHMKPGHHLVEFFPGPALVTREFLARKGIAHCIEEDSRFSIVAKEIQSVVGSRLKYVFGHVKGIGDYDLFDETVGRIFDTFPQHPWSEVHPTIHAFITMPPMFSEAVISRLIRLMAEKYLLYSAGRVKMHALIPSSVYSKMSARPGESAYSKTSALVSAFADLELCATLADSSMIYPSKAPKYSLITLVPKEAPLVGTNFEMECFEFVLRQTLIQRRTPLRLVVLNLGPNGHELLELSNLDPELVPSDMTPEQFGRLAKAYENWEHRSPIDDTETMTNPYLE